MLSLVSENKQVKISKYCYVQDAKRALYSDILIRYIACKTLDIGNQELVFSSGECGKPFLVGYPDFHYNISHSGEWVVCAISNTEVGVDIEQVMPIDFNIAKRFFTEYEYSQLLTQPQNEQLNYFYKIWTLKESYIKCTGEGLKCPLNSFEFQIEGKDIQFTTENSNEFYFSQFEVEGYKLAVCSVTGISEVRVQYYMIKTCMDEIVDIEHV